MIKKKEHRLRTIVVLNCVNGVVCEQICRVFVLSKINRVEVVSHVVAARDVPVFESIIVVRDVRTKKSFVDVKSSVCGPVLFLVESQMPFADECG